MTKEQFSKLKFGDFIEFNGRGGMGANAFYKGIIVQYIEEFPVHRHDDDIANNLDYPIKWKRINGLEEMYKTVERKGFRKQFYGKCSFEMVELVRSTGDLEIDQVLGAFRIKEEIGL